MGFSIIAEQVEFIDLTLDRKKEVIDELKKLPEFKYFIQDIEEGIAIGDHFGEDDMLTSVAGITEHSQLSVKIGEAYSALIMLMNERADELEYAVGNIRCFCYEFQNIESVSI